jgi:hypothetical protein
MQWKKNLLEEKQKSGQKGGSSWFAKQEPKQERTRDLRVHSFVVVDGGRRRRHRLWLLLLVVQRTADEVACAPSETTWGRKHKAIQGQGNQQIWYRQGRGGWKVKDMQHVPGGSAVAAAAAMADLRCPALSSSGEGGNRGGGQQGRGWRADSRGSRFLSFCPCHFFFLENIFFWSTAGSTDYSLRPWKKITIRCI